VAPAEAGPGLEDPFGDGSGPLGDEPAGRSCLADDRLKDSILRHAGAVTGGRDHVAERAPYVHAPWSHRQELPPGGLAIPRTKGPPGPGSGPCRRV
jgi:hypothetical protein